MMLGAGGAASRNRNIAVVSQSALVGVKLFGGGDPDRTGGLPVVDNPLAGRRRACRAKIAVKAFGASKMKASRSRIASNSFLMILRAPSITFFSSF